MHNQSAPPKTRDCPPPTVQLPIWAGRPVVVPARYVHRAWWQRPGRGLQVGAVLACLMSVTYAVHDIVAAL